MRRRIGRWLLAIGGVFGSYVGAVSLIFVLNVHQTGQSQPLPSLPTLPFPAPPQQIMIIAPHPDDETLGCGGLIADATRRGVPVYVVFLTNGDAQSANATLIARGKPSEADYVQLGEIRQTEAVRAVAQLGVPKERVVFLNYPDRGLWQMWQQCTDFDDLYRSPYTGQSRSPYPREDGSEGLYYGKALVNDLRALIAQHRPTDLYVTHPLDDHGDHMAAAAFTMAAYLQVQAKREIEDLRLHYYLVHRGDWPLPQGYHPDGELAPPPGLSEKPFRWAQLPLSAPVQQVKQNALDQYVSQRSIMNRFLVSFLRQNEIFMSDSSLIQFNEVSGVTIDGKPEEWQKFDCAYRDPADDSPVRHLQPGADITGVWIAHRENQIVCLAQMRGPIPPNVEVRFYITVLTPKGNLRTRMWSSFSWQQSEKLQGRIVARRSSAEAELTLPTSRKLALAIMVETRSVGVIIDRTGYLWLKP